MVEVATAVKVATAVQEAKVATLEARPAAAGGELTPGSVMWMAQVKGSGSAAVKHLLVQSDGSMIVSGEVEGGSATFADGIVPVSSPSKETAVFVAKLNSLGVFEWATGIGGKDYDFVSGLVTDPTGNIYLTGYFRGMFKAGNELSSTGDYDIFVSKLAPDGTPLWVKQFGSVGVDEGMGIAYRNGQLAVSVGFNGELVVDQNNKLTSNGDMDIGVLLLDTDGVPLKSWSFGSAKDDAGGRLLFLPNGDLVVSAHFSAEFDLGGHTLKHNFLLDFALFSMKTSNGTIPWAVFYGGSGADTINALDVLPDDRVAIAGTFINKITIGDPLDASGALDRDAFTALLDSEEKAQWARRFGGDDVFVNANLVTDALLDIAVDASDNLVSVGRCAESFDFPFTPEPCSEGDAVLTRYSNKGTSSWSLHAQGDGVQQALAIDIDGDGNLLIGGVLSSKMKLSVDEILTSDGATDGFVVKIAAP